MKGITHRIVGLIGLVVVAVAMLAPASAAAATRTYRYQETTRIGNGAEECFGWREGAGRMRWNLTVTETTDGNRTTIEGAGTFAALRNGVVVFRGTAEVESVIRDGEVRSWHHELYYTNVRNGTRHYCRLNGYGGGEATVHHKILS